MTVQIPTNGSAPLVYLQVYFVFVYLSCFCQNKSICFEKYKRPHLYDKYFIKEIPTIPIDNILVQHLIDSPRQKNKLSVTNLKFLYHVTMPNKRIIKNRRHSDVLNKTLR